MPGAGNDIIDLSQIDRERSKERRFFSKFLSTSEQQLYVHTAHSYMPFEIFTWLAWSVKESVYKYVKREQVSLVFSPVKIVITELTVSSGNLSRPDEHRIYTGTAVFHDTPYFFTTKVTDAFISSVVCDNPRFDNMHWGIKQIETTGQGHQSLAVRKLVLEKLSEFFPAGELRIDTVEAGYPIVLQDDAYLDIPVSFSHHHAFVAYAFRLS